MFSHPRLLIFKYARLVMRLLMSTYLPSRARFASEKDYRAHQNSAHVQGLYKEYLAHITEPLSSIPLIHPRTDWWVVSRGLEQHNTDLHTYLLDAPGWE